MRRTFAPIRIVGAAVLLPLALAAACADPPAPACTAYVTPPGTDLTLPPVQLQRDVAPILSRSCAFAGCHGAASGGNHGVYLGTDGARVHAEAVGKPSSELPAMSYVAPGDPASSYVMHKIDGDLCTLTARCEGGDCGVSMPQGSDLMAIRDRDIVRRWIAQGAKDD
jgi:hypothetical protein